MKLIEINPRLGIWQLEDSTNGYLIFRNGESLLIDCPCADMQGVLQSVELPMPGSVIHTQVQEEHCREWGAFPAAKVYVHEESVEVAKLSPAYFAALDTVWPPDRPWVPEPMGKEQYGIAGCPTERPPRKALNIAGTLKAGDKFSWQGINFEIINLPGCGRRSLGFFWRNERMLFSADLLRAGGYLVNYYDIDRNYGTPLGFDELKASLEAANNLEAGLFLPATGPTIANPRQDIASLKQRLEAMDKVPVITDGSPRERNYQPVREFGLFKEVLPSIAQNNNFGNMILFVDQQGRGLCIDPDICVWRSWQENCQDMHDQLDLLEKNMGLKSIEYALITHPHGDHMQYSNLLRERYGTKICATADVAALMENPKRYRYPALVNWYGFPFDQVMVDIKLAYEKAFNWNSTAITPVHACGHCFAHAAFYLEWNGTRIACTGDTLQYTCGGIAVGRGTSYNDTSWPERGFVNTFKRLIALKPDLVLGGHSNSFFDKDGIILRNHLQAAEQALPVLAAPLHDGDMMRAMTPPHYDAMRPPLVTRPF